jgi:hypothetical protein
MTIAPLDSPFPKLDGRLLLVVCSYRGGIGNPPPFSMARALPQLGRLGALFDRLALYDLRQFIAANRDFFANPRTLAYQAGLVEDLLRTSVPSQVTIAFDQALEADLARNALDSLGTVYVRAPAQLVRSEDAADAIVVVYPDALGLGWEVLEGSLANTQTYLLNGRRRIQLFDAAARRRLRWHRLLAITRIPELVAGLLVFPAAAMLAAWDAMRGKS